MAKLTVLASSLGLCRMTEIPSIPESSSLNQYHLCDHVLPSDGTLVMTCPRSVRKPIGWKRGLAHVNDSRFPMPVGGLISWLSHYRAILPQVRGGTRRTWRHHSSLS